MNELRNMRPSRAIDNPCYRGTGNCEPIGNLLVGILTCLMQKANFLDLLFRQARTRMAFAFRRLHAKNVKAVSDILASGKPFEIVRAIVRFVSIPVVADHASGARANKSLCYQDMCISMDALTRVVCEPNLDIASSYRCRIHDVTSRTIIDGAFAANSSVIAHFIQAFKANNIAPFFKGNFLCVHRCNYSRFYTYAAWQTADSLSEAKA